MVGTAPLSPGPPYMPTYPFSTAVDDDIATALQAQHITDPAVPLLGFSNNLPGYGSACFLNAAISLLVNTLPISGFIVANTRGQLESSPTARLLENVIREYFSAPTADKQARVDRAIQRLYNRVNYTTPIDPNKLTKRWTANSQQDAVEMLNLLLDAIADEFPRGTSGPLIENSFTALSQIAVAAVTQCITCSRKTNLHNIEADEQSWTVLRVGLSSNITTINGLIAGAFSQTSTTVNCTRCQTIPPMLTKWGILRPSEVVFVDIDQVPAAGVKPGQKVPDIPEILNLGDYLHELTVANKITARYRLVGIINHQGSTARAGHYVSHVRDLAGNWHLLDDSNVSASSLAKAQEYDPALKAKQMIPRMLAYVRIHDNDGNSALTTRTKTPDVGPKPFLHSQIVFDDITTLAALQNLCKAGNLSTSNTKTTASLRSLIQRNNGADSTFATRRKNWLINTLVEAGELVDRTDSQAKLAAQLRAFMAAQPTTAPAPQAGAGTASMVPNPTAATQAALDIAKARITLLEATIAGLQPNPTIEAGTSPRARGTVTTDQIRELIRRLPASPPSSLQRGTKRTVEEPAAEILEREKRRAIRLADQACTAIDTGVRFADSAPNNGSPASDAENQDPRTTRCGSQPSGNSPSSTLRCHRCPIINGEVHHMHANVCGWPPGRTVASITETEMDEDTRLILTRAQTGEEVEPEVDVVHHTLPGDGANMQSFLGGTSRDPIIIRGSTERSTSAAANGSGNANANGNGNGSESGIIIEDGDDFTFSLLNTNFNTNANVNLSTTPPPNRSRSIPGTGIHTASFLNSSSRSPPRPVVRVTAAEVQTVVERVSQSTQTYAHKCQDLFTKLTNFKPADQ